MAAGKDYFTDKAPLTTLEQLAAARKATAETGRKYMCYYSERLHVESAVYAGQLIAQGAIGKVLNVTGSAHTAWARQGGPSGSLKREKYGGILCDIGSHQIEQFLFFAGEGGRAGAVQPAWPTMPIRNIRSWRTTGIAPLWAPMAPPTISAWIGLPPMAFAPGGMGAPLFWVPRAISRSASTLTWRGRNGRAITCSW